MAEIRINATGGLKLYDADDSHYAQIVAGTITSNVDAITLGHDTVTIADNLSLGSDSAVLKFGADGDTTLTHTDGTGLTLNSTNKLCFNDASQFVQGSSGTVLSIGATDEIDLTATAIDINGTCDISGTFSLGGTNITTTAAELNLIDGGTSRGTTALADGDGILINDGGTMRMTNVTTVKTYMSTSLDGIDDQTSSNDDQLTIKDGEVVINEDSDDLDFRVESNSNSHMFCVDGGGDRILIGTYGGTGEGGVGEVCIRASHSTTHTSGELTHAEAGNGTIIEIFNGDTTDNNYSGILFTDGGGFGNCGIYGINKDHDSNGGGELAFFTRTVNTGTDAQYERMRIDNDGDVCVGKPVPVSSSQLGGVTLAPLGRCNITYSGTGGHGLMTYHNGNGEIGSISGSGSATSYNTSSDYRLKENETAITDGIERIKQLKPYKFNFKSEKDKTVDGFFAHEVSSIVPEAITGDKDGMLEINYTSEDVLPEGKKVGDFKEYHSTEIKPQSIDQSKLVPLLVAAVKELTAKVEALEG